MKIRIKDSQADELRILSKNTGIAMTILVGVAVARELSKYARLINSPLIKVGKGKVGAGVRLKHKRSKVRRLERK